MIHVSRTSKVASAKLLTVLALGVWFAAAVAAGLGGIFSEPGRPPLRLFAFLAVPVVGFVAAYRASASLRAFADGISWPLLIGSHLWRFVGLGFIVAWLTGNLAGGFALPAGLGDITAALGALLLLPSLRAGERPRSLLLAWNTLGVIDLFAAITLGLLFSNSTLGALSPGTATTQLMVTFPISLIPTFFVPLFIMMHLLTFKRIADLRRERGAGHAVSAHATLPGRRIPSPTFQGAMKASINR